MNKEFAKRILKEQALDLAIKGLELAGEALLNAAKQLSESRRLDEQKRELKSDTISNLKNDICIQ